ncbi:MAG: TRAP transporter small permease, partial [Hylemonella sp.]
MHKSQANAGAMHRFRQRYALLLEWVVMFLMVVLAVEVTLGIVYRTLGQSLVWYDEVASVLLAWLTFYGSALASVKRGHIGCPELVDQLSPPLKRAIGIFSQMLVIAFFALLGWVGASILPVLAGDALVSLPWVPMSFV